MGGYVSNRLFCVFEKSSSQSLPDGANHGFSVSGLRAYKSGISGAGA